MNFGEYDLHKMCLYLLGTPGMVSYGVDMSQMSTYNDMFKIIFTPILMIFSHLC